MIFYTAGTCFKIRQKDRNGLWCGFKNQICRQINYLRPLKSLIWLLREKKVSRFQAMMPRLKADFHFLRYLPPNISCQIKLNSKNWNATKLKICWFFPIQRCKMQICIQNMYFSLLLWNRCYLPIFLVELNWILKMEMQQEWKSLVGRTKLGAFRRLNFT